MGAFTITELYDFLSNKFDKETAKNFANFIEAKMNSELDNKIQHLATKEDVAKANADNIRWMFIFWIGQVAATFGFILLFLNK